MRGPMETTRAVQQVEFSLQLLRLSGATMQQKPAPVSEELQAVVKNASRQAGRTGNS